MVIATQRAGSTPHATGLPMQMILRCSGGVTSRLHWCYVKMSLSIPAEKQSWCPSHGQGPDIMGLPKCVRSRTDGPEASKGAWWVDRSLTHSLTRPPIHPTQRVHFIEHFPNARQYAIDAFISATDDRFRCSAFECGGQNRSHLKANHSAVRSSAHCDVRGCLVKADPWLDVR